MKLQECEIKKYNEIEEINILNYNFEQNVINDILEINFSKIEKTIYPEIENIFSKIIYDLKNDTVINANEIFNNWDQIYTKYLLCNNNELNNIAVDLNKYYKHTKNLEFIANNGSFFPYLKLLLNPKEVFSNIIFYNILGFDELKFNVIKYTNTDKDTKNIEIKGEIPSTFNFIALKKEVRDSLGISPDKLFQMKISLSGNIFYEKNILKKGHLEIKLSTNNYIEKKYKLQIDV